MKGVSECPFMSMGLAGSVADDVALVEMAVYLGAPMGAAESIENFVQMLARQDIARTDFFLISPEAVRSRFKVLQATEGLSRQQAFMQAVVEQGTMAMGHLEDGRGD